MKLIAVLPVKPLAEGKTRLEAVLGAAGRRALNRRFFMRTLGLAARQPGPDGTLVVSRDEAILALAQASGAHGVRETATGLNRALDLARRHVQELGADALLVLPVDLPRLDVADVDAMVAAAQDGARVVIAPDENASGTNALLLAPPDTLEFCFGDDSFKAHLEAARRSGIAARVIDRPGLAFDVDTPADHARLTALERAPRCQGGGDNMRLPEHNPFASADSGEATRNRDG